MTKLTLNPDSLANRGILRGVECTCGQHWPDFVRTESARQVRTECCGALYQIQTGEGSLVTLSLLHRPAHLGPEVPTPDNTFIYDPKA
jgi:hypothetical protein